MKSLIVIGEVLIDLILKDNKYIPQIGGAPLNAYGAFINLGGKGLIYSSLGNDYFGNYIISNLSNNPKIDISRIKITNKAKTQISLVTNLDNERYFEFLEDKPSYNYLKAKDIIPSDFDNSILHFCSFALEDNRMIKPHLKAIKCADIISFDLNLRPAFYNNDKLLKKRINKFIKHTNILKISDDEYAYLFKDNNPLNTLKNLVNNKLKLILYTCGSKGSYAITKDYICFCPSIKVENIVDLTGAGDCFIGSALYYISSNNINLDNIREEELDKLLEFSNKYAALSISKIGGFNP